jgi:hypothetical protein
MKFITLPILIIILSSCENILIDLSTFNELKTEPFKNSQIKRIDEQKGNWEFDSNFEPILNSSPKLSKHYFFNFPNEIEKLKFSSFTIDKEKGVKVIEYNNKISFFKLGFKNDETFKVLSFLKYNLGENYISFKSTLSVNENNTSKIKILKNQQKNDIKTNNDPVEGEVIVFNDFYLWEKDDFIVFYRLGLTKDEFSNEIVFATKKILKDKIVFGYHNVPEDNYLKNIKL